MERGWFTRQLIQQYFHKQSKKPIAYKTQDMQLISLGNSSNYFFLFWRQRGKRGGQANGGGGEEGRCTVIFLGEDFSSFLSRTPEFVICDHDADGGPPTRYVNLPILPVNQPLEQPRKKIFLPKMTL
jgi:hypothetical protein